ncbi:unnamed protein product [Rangifer tarandus platyrhynchus]|uniref:Uncharacterized protein n=2 Tax=Rangifer tarandus platyrhynchus TaxID=3082113 RepID=A0ABN8YJA0_RANTA|nr:unnamed protein product [Rangifer tarandus platyrhynchus]
MSQVIVNTTEQSVRHQWSLTAVRLTYPQRQQIHTEIRHKDIKGSPCRASVVLGMCGKLRAVLSENDTCTHADSPASPPMTSMQASVSVPNLSLVLQTHRNIYRRASILRMHISPGNIPGRGWCKT